MSPISRKQAVMVNNLTNINKTNSDGKKSHHYQHNKQSWSTISSVSTKRTVMVKNVANINKTNNDGQQSHQHQ
jgi:hypothetical protein